MKLSRPLTAGLLALAVNSTFAAGSPGVESTTQGFLQALADGGGKPLETLAPKDARAVLTGAQTSVKGMSPASRSSAAAFRSTARPWRSASYAHKAPRALLVLCLKCITNTNYIFNLSIPSQK